MARVRAVVARTRVLRQARRRRAGKLVKRVRRAAGR